MIDEQSNGHAHPCTDAKHTCSINIVLLDMTTRNLIVWSLALLSRCVQEKQAVVAMNEE
jgi:hypothetical protein